MVSSLPVVTQLAGKFVCQEPEGARIQLDNTPGTVILKPKNQMLVALNPGDAVVCQFELGYEGQSERFGKVYQPRVGSRLISISRPEKQAVLTAAK